MNAEQQFIIDQYAIIHTQNERIQESLNALQLERMQQTEEIVPLSKKLEELSVFIKSHIQRTEAHLEKKEEQYREEWKELNQRFDSFDDRLEKIEENTKHRKWLARNLKEVWKFVVGGVAFWLAYKGGIIWDWLAKKFNF